MQVTVSRVNSSKNLTKLSAQEIFFGVGQKAAIMDVKLRNRHASEQADITLFKEETKYLFRSNEIITHPRDDTLKFKIVFEPGKANSETGHLQAPPRLCAIMADNLWFATLILTHRVSYLNSLVRRNDVVTRPVLAKMASNQHKMQVVEINHPKVPDNSIKMSEAVVDDSQITPEAEWIIPRGFLLPPLPIDAYRHGKAPPRKFVMLFYPNKVEVLGLLQCKVRPRLTAGNQTIVQNVFPIKFSMPCWTHVSGPSLSFSWMKFTTNEILLLSLHCNRANDVFRTLDQEDLDREQANHFEDFANEEIWFPTFYHDFSTHAYLADKLECPVERALSTHKNETGIVLPIRIWSPSGDVHNALAHQFDRLKKILMELKYYSLPKPDRTPPRFSRGNIEELLHESFTSPIVVRIVVPIAKTLALTDRFYSEVIRAGRDYMCYGAIVMLIQNGMYPRRWIASLMGHIDQHPNDEDGETLKTELLGFDCLKPAKVPDNIMFFTLKELFTRARTKSGQLLDILYRYQTTLKMISQANPPIPTHTGDLLTLFHAYISPCRTYIMGPYTEPSNRVLRENTHIQPAFMRATFRGNDGQVIFYSEQRNWLLLHKIRLTFRDGFRFGCRLHTYLAYSSSQLKSQGFWSYCEFPYSRALIKYHPRATEILEPLGSFNDLFIGKQAARLGQCFSSTRHATDIPLHNTSTEVDVESPIILEQPRNGSFCFTDGVGSYGSQVGIRVAIYMKLDSIPSAVQIRFKGAKGMLVVDPAIPQENVRLRKSQTKFIADHRALEICEYSKPLTLQLNKALILLLQTLGVPETAFLHILESENILLTKILASRSAAMKFLRTERLQSLCELVPLVLALVQGGFDIYSTPILRHCLRHFRRWLWRNDYQEFRLPIRQGIAALGVNDTSGELRYDCGEGAPEVFLKVSTRRYYSNQHVMAQEHILVSSEDIYYSKDELDENDFDFNLGDRASNKFLHATGRVIEGWVLITRSPGHNPGDVQLAKAVKCPSLNHLVDCLVFPGPGKIEHPRHPGNGQNPYYKERGTSYTGCRDIPNMLSGGDLDGDLFQIIWDPQIVNPVLEKFLSSDFCPNPPADYTIPFKVDPRASSDILYIQPKVPSNLSKTQQYGDWFVKWHQHDNLGRICNTWLRRMLCPEVFNGSRAYDPSCLILAECASTAVDFAKSGKTVKAPSFGVSIPGKPYFAIDSRDETWGISSNRKFGMINNDCHDSILGKLWDRIEEYRKPFISDSCCILTIEKFYTTSKEIRPRRIQAQFDSLEVLASRISRLAYDDFEIDACDEQAQGGGGSCEDDYWRAGAKDPSDMSHLLTYGSQVDTYYLVPGADSAPCAMAEWMPCEFRCFSKYGSLDWQLLSNLMALCRVDFQNNTDDGRMTKIEVFITKAFPPEFSRESFTLWDGKLDPSGKSVEEDTVRMLSVNETKTLDGPSILHDPLPGGRCVVFGIRPVHWSKNRQYIIQTFQVIVRDRTTDSSNIIGISNEVSVFELAIVNGDDCRTSDGNNQYQKFASSEAAAFPERIEAQTGRPDLLGLACVKRNTSRYTRAVERYKQSLSVAMTVKNHQTSVYRAILILYYELRKNQNSSTEMPDVLRVRKFANDSVAPTHFANMVIPRVLLSYSDFKDRWHQKFGMVLTNHLFQALYNSSDITNFFIVYDQVKQIVYSPYCNSRWVAPPVIAKTDLPTDWADFVCDNHMCIFLWQKPFHNKIERSAFTMTSLGLFDKLSACTQRKIGIDEIMKLFYTVPQKEKDQMPGVSEWLYLNDYAKILFANSTTEVTSQIKEAIDVYLWLPTRQRLDCLKVLKDSQADHPSPNRHDLRKDEGTPQGAADNRMRNECHLSFTYNDLYVMISELGTLPDASVRKINPQFTNPVAVIGGKIVMDRRLIHKDAGSHMVFATKLAAHYQTRLRQIMVEIGLTPHLHEIAAVTGCLHGDTKEGERKLRLNNSLASLVTSLKKHIYDKKFGLGNKTSQPIDCGLNNSNYEARASAVYLASVLNLKTNKTIAWHPQLFCGVNQQVCQNLGLDCANTRKIVMEELKNASKIFFEEADHDLALCSTPYVLYGSKLIDRMSRVQSFYFTQRARLKILSAMWIRLRALLSFVVQIVVDPEQQMIVMTILEHKSISKIGRKLSNVPDFPSQNALVHQDEASLAQHHDPSMELSWSPEILASVDFESISRGQSIDAGLTAVSPASMESISRRLNTQMCLYEFVRAETMDFTGKKTPELLREDLSSNYKIVLDCRCKGKASTTALTKAVMRVLHQNGQLGPEFRESKLDWDDYELVIENEEALTPRITCFCVDPLQTAPLVKEGGNTILWYTCFAPELKILAKTDNADGWTQMRPAPFAINIDEEAEEQDEVLANDEEIEQLILNSCSI